MSRYYNPVRVYIGAEGLSAFVHDEGDLHAQVSRVLLLTRGHHSEAIPELQPLLLMLEKKEVLLKEFHHSNPDLGDVLRFRQEIGAFDFQLIIAIGGGSVMDMAKALTALQGLSIESAEELRSAILAETYRQKERMVTWVGVPTTSGTGSEVTSWATVWDEEQGCKYSIADPRLYASSALLIPELTATKPLRLTAATALDALSHATEAYWAVRTNPISRMYALQAIQRICRFLPELKQEPRSLEARKQLALASLFAGLAFSNTRTTACHSISYPMTLLHGVDHGIAASFTLGAVMGMNWPVLIEPDQLLEAYGARTPEEVQAIILRLYEMFDLPTRLREYGISRSDVEGISQRAFTKGRMDNNPVELSEQQVRDILTALL